MNEEFEKWHYRVFGYNNSSANVELDQIIECNRRYAAWQASRDALLQDELGVYNEGVKNGRQQMKEEAARVAEGIEITMDGKRARRCPGGGGTWYEDSPCGEVRRSAARAIRAL